MHNFSMQLSVEWTNHNCTLELSMAKYA